MSTSIKVQPTLTAWNIEIFKKIPQILLLWNERYRQRKQLAQMNDFLLKDIGISRSTALQEAQKPFWKK